MMAAQKEGPMATKKASRRKTASQKAASRKAASQKAPRRKTASRKTVKAKIPAHRSAAWRPAPKSVRQAEAALPPPPVAAPAPPSSPAAEPGPPGPPKLTGPAVVHWEIQASDAAAQGRFF